MICSIHAPVLAHLGGLVVILVFFKVGQHRVDLLLPLLSLVLGVRRTALVGRLLRLPIRLLQLPLEGLVVIIEEGGLRGVEVAWLLRIFGRLGPDLV